MLKFEVLNSSWTADGEEFPADGNPYEIERPSKDLVRLASCSHDAGVINVTEGLDESAYQSQEDGEAAYAAAMENGSWHESNAVQAELDAAAKAATLAEIAANAADDDPEE